MNAVMMMAYNTTPEQLEMTKEAVASVLAQDNPVKLWFIDNGSTPETWEWIQGWTGTRRNWCVVDQTGTNVSPVGIVNALLPEIFGDEEKFTEVLGVPNDVILPPNFYSELLKWPRGIVTASMSSDKNFPRVTESHAVNECTPMAVALIRRWAWEALVSKDGYFLDPQIFHYASDNDLALRMAACGIHGLQLDLPYFHSGSASWRMATPEVSKAITDQADVDRSYFIKKWGFGVSDPQYGQRCGDINFRGVPVG